MASPPNHSTADVAAQRAHRVVDCLPSSFDVASDESQWLLTILGAEDLRFIFEGTRHDEDN